MPAADALIGRLVANGKVELQGLLGQGGMGRIYRGYHHALHVPVAVKVLLPDAKDKTLPRRLMHEAAAVRKLSHPNLVRLYESGVDPFDNLLFVVMEFIEGQDLGTLVHGGKKVAARRACALMLQVLDGLEAAHQARVLHRDIKPPNLMVTRQRAPDGRVVDWMKVVDFGLAKVTTGELSRLTQSGMVVGTPAFMAREQLLGEELDPRVDVYACGVTLYRMLSGTLPYKGDRVAAVLKSMREPPPPIPDVHDALNDAVVWAMALERETRCPSARAFAERLAPFAVEPRG